MDHWESARKSTPIACTEDCIKRCMTKMDMLVVGAWAGETVACDFGHWSEGVRVGTMGVVLLVTVGVVLLSCAGVRYGHVPIGRIVTGEPEVANAAKAAMTLRSMRDKIINHVRENVESLTLFWISAVGR